MQCRFLTWLRHWWLNNCVSSQAGGYDLWSAMFMSVSTWITLFSLLYFFLLLHLSNDFWNPLLFVSHYCNHFASAFTLFVAITFPFFGSLLGFFGGFAFAPTTYFVSPSKPSVIYIYIYHIIIIYIKGIYFVKKPIFVWKL